MFKSAPKFDGNKTKVQLKMLLNRLTLLSSKKTNLAKGEKRKIAMLLRDSKEANARILVEHIIREDYTLEAYECLRQYAELLIARLNVMITDHQLKPEIERSVNTLLYAGYLMGNEIDELKALLIQFSAKYGKEHAKEVIDNKEKYLEPRLIKMLTSVDVPDPSLIELYLTEIAKAYNVEYVPSPPTTTPGGQFSATVGVPLPMPGMPVPVAADVPDLSDPAPSAPAPPAAPPVVPPTAPPTQPPTEPPVVTGVDVTSAAGPSVYPVVLEKIPQGFGVAFDEDNVITTLVAGGQFERCGLIAVGDVVVAVNGKACTADCTPKTLAFGVPDGMPVTFTLRKGGAGGKVDPGSSSSSTAGVPAQGVYPPSPFEQTPQASEPSAQMPAPASVPPAAPAPSSSQLPPYPANPTVENLDDVLAQRLEALKRS